MLHANHCGKVTAFNFPTADALQTRQLVGAAQIIDGNGSAIVRRSFVEGEGIVMAEITRDVTFVSENRSYPNRFWIPDLPESYTTAWNTINPKAKEYYEEIARPYYYRQRK